jgi:LacI family transcriptional regulator
MREPSSVDSTGKRPSMLRGRTTPSVFLFVETSREFGRGLLYGIAKYSRLHGPWRVYRQPAGLDSSMPNWKDWPVDGAIVRDVRMVDKFVGAGFPVIFAQHNRESYAPFPAIVTDSQSIGRMGAEHFLDRGFHNFAYCGLNEFVWSRQRGQYFVERLAKAGATVSKYEPTPSKRKRLWRSEQPILARWLKSLAKPVALMCCNDDRALRVVETCKLVNLHVPDEVAVLGVDNDVLVCDLADPPISSIALNTAVAGYAAAELLDRLIEGEPMNGQRISVYPSHIVTRLSTDILAITDREVAAALRYIREHVDKFIQVDDVVEATRVSRRVLEKRFRAVLRRSIHQEIRRIRVNHIIQLLLGTDLNVTQIARRSGFDGVEHVSRYFRREVGMTLRDYRRRHTRQ